MAEDLQRCMEPLMQLKGDDMEASLLEAADNEPGESLTLTEEATLLGKDPSPQEVQETTTHPPDYQEETHDAKGAAGLATLKMHRCRYHCHL